MEQPDIDTRELNASPNEHLNTVIERMQANPQRRRFLLGGTGAAVLGFVGLPACGSSDTALTRPASLSFSAVTKSVTDNFTVPAGYTARVLHSFGDPIKSGVAAFTNLGTDDATSYGDRIGDNHDGMHFFGLSAAGYTPGQADRGLLVVNHEYMQWLFMHNRIYTIDGSGNRTSSAEVLKEMASMGVSVVEVVRTGTTWSYVQGSTYNRRITTLTPMEMSGPARGNDLFKTKYSPTGVATRGTFNNCANGYTPWGTYLTCEENWVGGFRRTAAGGVRTAKDNASLSRYGLGATASGNWGWATLAGDEFERWQVDVKTADATGDYRNAPYTFGWTVEIDPFAPSSVPKKRTSLGRFFHEGAWPSRAIAGKKLAFYQGCDARGEYIYKYVSNAAWDVADVGKGMTAGDKYLDDGKLYVAKFNDDGTGQWIELAFGSGAITASYAPYAFSSQADVLINARHAADAVGATKMDRPEWGAVDPINGMVYMTLTNSNSANRVVTGTPTGRAALTDAANPRSYNDPRTDGTAQRGNPNGHIIRWRETGDDPAATTFAWDIYLFGARAGTSTATVNISGLSANNDFSSPDGLWFSKASGLLWIQTDDGAYTDVTNCMLLAALPGTVGDGAVASITGSDAASNTRTVTSPVGKAASDATIRRFLVGPKDCEITGLAESADGRALFVNVQHPGEESFSSTSSSWPAGVAAANLFGVDTNAAVRAAVDAQLANPAAFNSRWPATQASRPRSSTVVVTKDDGGVIGL